MQLASLPSGRRHRTAAIAALCALAVGTAGCGSESLNTAGEHLGSALGSVQNAATGLGASSEVHGIGEQISDLRSRVPEASAAALETIETKLETDIGAAGGDSAKIQEATDAAVAAIARLSGGDAIEQFKTGVRKGYADAID